MLWDGGWVAAGGGVMPGFQLSTIPLRHCRSAVGGQPMSVLVTSSLCIRQYISSISVLTRNGSYGTEERQRYNGTAERNGETATAERQRNGGNQALLASTYSLSHIPRLYESVSAESYTIVDVDPG